MARVNYKADKRRRELQKQKKREEKLQRKLAKKKDKDPELMDDGDQAQTSEIAASEQEPAAIPPEPPAE